MRRELFLVAFAAVAATACKATIPDDTFACIVDSECPDGLSCSAGFCRTGAVSSDAGRLDAGRLDAGPVDAGPVDAGRLDAGPVDAGPIDAARVDAGPVDAAVVDAGDPDAGPVPGESSPTECSDGLDNDGDGSTDCEDSDCCTSGVCMVGAGACACPLLGARPEIVVSGDLPDGTVWTCGSEYQLDGQVYIPSGLLTIGPGTQIRGASNSALVVERAARLDARGTQDRPIVFTSAQSPGAHTPGAWGGIVLLGSAPINAPGGMATLPILDPARVQYGGTATADDCGQLEYVVIGYSGDVAPSGFPLAGIAFAGCGTGTSVSYLQSYASADTGIYVAGGTLRLDHVMSWANAVDGLLYSEGWVGGLQYGFLNGSRGSNVRGLTSFTDPARRPVSSPGLYNLTVVDAAGPSAQMGPQAGGVIANSLFPRNAMSCVDVHPTANPLIPASLSVSTTLFWDCGGPGGTMYFRGTGAAVFRTDSSYSNYFEDHDTSGPGWVPPVGTAPARGAGGIPSPFEPTAYLGAFAPGATAWTDGWTASAID